MYHNIGKKIKTLAKILGIVLTIFCILGGIGIIVLGLIAGHEMEDLLGLELNPITTIIVFVVSGLLSEGTFLSDECMPGDHEMLIHV